MSSTALLTQHPINLVLILKNIQNEEHVWRYGNIPHCKCMKNCSFKGINESYDPSISWNKNKFSIIAELQASPLTGSIILHLKGSKWTLQKRKADVGMQQNYSRCSDHFARNTALGRLSDVGRNFHFLQKLPRIRAKVFKLQFLEIPTSVFYFYMSEYKSIIPGVSSQKRCHI